jgi:hypothetical protein
LVGVKKIGEKGTDEDGDRCRCRLVQAVTHKVQSKLLANVGAIGGAAAAAASAGGVVMPLDA